MSPWCGRTALWVRYDRAPSPVPMVSPKRNDVRGVLFLRSYAGEGWGRIATRALIAPGGPRWHCFGRALLYPAV